jgi:hypothetical protein
MKPTVSVKVSGPGGAKVKALLTELTKTQVLVGVPQKTTKRNGGKITNAELAYIHSNGVRSFIMRAWMDLRMKKGTTYPAALQMYIHSKGSPNWNIPPRPIIEPAIMDKQNRRLIEAELVEAGKAALAGDKQLMMQFFKRAGMTAQNVVKAWFTNPRNGWAPNAPSTIKRKGSDKPLIDKGQLRNAIDYVIITK